MGKLNTFSTAYPTFVIVEQLLWRQKAHVKSQAINLIWDTKYHLHGPQSFIACFKTQVKNYKQNKFLLHLSVASYVAIHSFRYTYTLRIYENCILSELRNREVPLSEVILYNHEYILGTTCMGIIWVQEYYQSFRNSGSLLRKVSL